LTEVIIIVIAALGLLLFLTNRKTDSKTTNEISASDQADESIEDPADEIPVHIDENGNHYRIIEKTREIPRKTFIKGVLNGKYWGEIEEELSFRFTHSQFYDFNIYEVSLKNALYGSSPFRLLEDLSIPRERLPKHLNTILEKDGKEYELNLHEPIFENIRFNRKLHQNEKDEVFGTIDAVVTGYVLDFIEEKYTEREYLHVTSVPADVESEFDEPEPSKTLTPTGKVEYDGDYKRNEYYYSDYKKTYWGDWEHSRHATGEKEGCLSIFNDLATGIVGIAFILLILPQVGIILPIIAIPLLLNSISGKLFGRLSRIFGILILLGMALGLYQFIRNSSQPAVVKEKALENEQERNRITMPIIDSVDGKQVEDTLIKHYRSWKNYDGKQFEGMVWTKNSSFMNAKRYKNGMNIDQNDKKGYDQLIYQLKEYDKGQLEGVYRLFDSILENNRFERIQFAELIVSFVQDIPYTLIVPGECDSKLYNDKFINQYLSSPGARCDGNEAFAINSPVEFMSSLNGDCDTRTLFLYTVLARYNYDVTLLSSEYYAHSLIGVNLPINGTSYQHQDKRYVLWETTVPNLKAGIIPSELSNMNYWRISLKSN
jgi:hypothetical protein